MTMHTGDDEVVLFQQLTQELRRVLDRHAQAQADAGEPRFGVHLALNATAYVLECLMDELVADDGDAARRQCQALLDHAQSRLVPSATARAH